MIKILNVLIFALTSSLIALWLFFFFSRKIRNIELYPINSLEAMVYLKTFLTMSLGILLLLLFLVIYRNLNFSKKNEKFNKITLWGKKFKEVIDKINIFYKSYVILFEFLDLQFMGGYLINLSRWVLKLKKKQTMAIILCFVALPGLIILVIFLGEIYLGQLHYFFYGLFLIIIPIIFRIILFMLTDVGPRLLPEFEKQLIKTPITQNIITKNGVEKIDVIQLSFQEDLQDLDLLLFLSNIYYPLKNIGPHMLTKVLPMYVKIVQYTSLTYFFIVSVNLIYVLFCNI